MKGQNNFYFLVTECFFNLFLDVYNLLDKLEQSEFKLEKIMGFRNMQEKLGKYEYLQGQVNLLVPKITVLGNTLRQRFGQLF